MTTTAKKKNVTERLVAARAKFKPFSKDVEGYGYSYADYNTIIQAIQEPLQSEGFVIEHLTAKDVHGDWTVETRIVDIDTETTARSTQLPLTGTDDSQKTGSSTTYARRYNLCLLFDLVADKDDDGAAASPSASKAKSKSTRKTPERSTKSKVW